MRRRVVRITGGIAVVGVALACALTWRVLVDPASASVQGAEAADAVVLFVGGRGERLTAAAELVAAGRAPVLVIPHGAAPGWPAANDLCGGVVPAGGQGGDRVEVVCPTPDPDTTRGEARGIAALARDRGWDSLIMVSSTYHVSRAELLLRRCFRGSVIRVAAAPDLSIRSWVGVIGHEWLGHIHARLVARSC